MNIFERASREKTRFLYNGVLSAEDLWDLSLKALDKVFKMLNKQVRDTNTESLLDTESKEDAVLRLKIAIVKHVFGVKKAAIEARQNEAKLRQDLQRLMELKAQKQDTALLELSEDELNARIAATKEQLS